MNNQQALNDISGIIGFLAPIIVVGFMVGMVKSIGVEEPKRYWLVYVTPEGKWGAWDITPAKPTLAIHKDNPKKYLQDWGEYYYRDAEAQVQRGRFAKYWISEATTRYRAIRNIQVMALPGQHSRARQIAVNTIITLSQRYATPEPNLIFKPIEVEAKFEEPSTILINDTFEEIVNTARAPKWDKFLRTVVAHEFKHYLQYRELGIPLSEIPEKEYEKYEWEAEMFGLEWGRISSFEEMSKMIAIANGAGALYLGGMPMEEAIRVATDEAEGIFRRG